jgi:teichuronic acid biosynthesis glycosyltransferase TuaG
VISVVIPVKNRKAELTTAVESVQRQTDSDWELVIVDDGSTDATFEEVCRLASHDDRIVPLFHPHRVNLGAGASRNLGVTVARGQYIAFLDSDDLLEVDALETFRDAFAQNPDIGVVYGRARIFGSRGFETSIGEGLHGIPVDMFPQLVRVNVISTGAIAIRDRLLGKYPFPPEMPNSQDWACWLRLAANHAFLFVDRDLLTVRAQRDSITGHGLSSVGSHCRYTVIQAEFLRQLVGTVTPELKSEIRQGLCWRSAECLLRSLFSLRRGRLETSVRWLLTWMKVACDPGIAGGSIRESVRTWARFRAGKPRESFIRPIGREGEKADIES